MGAVACSIGAAKGGGGGGATALWCAGVANTWFVGPTEPWASPVIHRYGNVKASHEQR